MTKKVFYPLIGVGAVTVVGAIVGGIVLQLEGAVMGAGIGAAVGLVGGWIAALIPSKGEREIKKLWPVVHRIAEFEPALQALTDEELRAKTTAFRSQIQESIKAEREEVEALRAKGLHFAIDDFGTGYSSLTYLKRLPIDTLKIDRSFVMDSVTNKDDQEIIKTIIAMARNLSMNTVAEGVETKEQQEFLTQHGCRMMQGYYFGRPMPAKQFEEMLHGDHHPYF